MNKKLMMLLQQKIIGYLYKLIAINYFQVYIKRVTLGINL